MIFMNEVMAMEHIHPIPGRKACLNPHFLTFAEEHDVLDGGLFVGEHGTLAANAGDDLEVDEMKVDRVRGRSGVLEIPKLDGAERGFVEDAVGDVGEGDAVDFPEAVAWKTSVSVSYRSQ